MKKRIYLSPPNIDQAENSAISDALSSGWIAPMGPAVDQFEQELSQRHQNRSVLALNSGTAALHLALKLAGVQNGSKVLISSFTFVAAANAVMYLGGEPIFLDSEPKTWNLDPTLLEEYLRSNPKTQAVIVTHLYGVPAQIEKIAKICQQYEVVLIEDAAEALGATNHHKPVGTFGEYGILSFNGNKIITTSGGGALICKSSSDREKALFWATQSKDHAMHYQHSEIGYNYRMSNILAALGIAQLKKLDDFIQAKKHIFDNYKKTLSATDPFDFIYHEDGAQPNYWLSTVLIRQEYLQKLSPGKIISELEKQNIEARPLWKPLHLQPLFEKNENFGGKVCEDLFRRGICLPSGSQLSRYEQQLIIDTILNITR